MLFKNTKAHKPDQPKSNDNLIKDGKTHIFNLIILDESGSMSIIENAARTGCNEVLSGIRKAQREHGDKMQQFVSILPFSTGAPHYIHKNVSAENVKDLEQADYQPSGCTALYDAMGFSLLELEKEADKYDDATGLVTVITDGEENSSVEFSGRAVYELVEKLKNKGWNFAFMGANQDVIKVAASLNIKHSISFSHDEEGMKKAMKKDAAARNKLFNRRVENFMETSAMAMEERQAFYKEDAESNSYFDDEA